MRRFSVALLIAAVALLSSGNQTAHATILTFQIDEEAVDTLGSLETLYPDYGDNVSSLTSGDYTYGLGNGFTPNVVVGYTHEAGAGSGHSYVDDDINWGDSVDYLHFEDGLNFWLTFTPDTGYGVTLNSFLIREYDHPSFEVLSPDVSWTVRQDSTLGAILATGTSASFTPGESRTISPNVNYDGTVVLEISFTGTDNQGAIALDDVNFDQYIVPEPSTAMLACAAMVGMATLVRRNRRRPSR